jgi:hypothetical protein
MIHRPLGRYVTALADVGFVIERVDELMGRPDAAAPFFLHLRARR